MDIRVVALENDPLSFENFVHRYACRWKEMSCFNEEVPEMSHINNVVFV